MAKFRSKPVEIEAFRPFNTRKKDAPEWYRTAFDIVGTVQSMGGDVLRVHTRHGWTHCRRGDWLIRLNDREMYPCSDEVFQAKYEPVA